jgi:hypothetical protein
MLQGKGGEVMATCMGDEGNTFLLGDDKASPSLALVWLTL